MATLGRSDSPGTVIGVQVKLTGTLSDPNDILVLGTVDGEIHSDHIVTVGPGAEVKGPITAARVVVGGVVKGNVATRERLEILPRGNINGNIETRDLVIQSGAIFNGRSTIIPSRETGPVEEPTEQPPPPSGVSPQVPVHRRVWPPIRLATPRRDQEEKSSAEQEDRDSRGDHQIEQEKEKPPYEVE